LIYTVSVSVPVSVFLSICLTHTYSLTLTLTLTPHHYPASPPQVRLEREVGNGADEDGKLRALLVCDRDGQGGVSWGV